MVRCTLPARRCLSSVLPVSLAATFISISLSPHHHHLDQFRRPTLPLWKWKQYHPFPPSVADQTTSLLANTGGDYFYSLCIFCCFLCLIFVLFHHLLKQLFSRATQFASFFPLFCFHSSTPSTGALLFLLTLRRGTAVCQ